jgi:hypothetical protein
LAIADRAGGEWPKRARSSAVRLSGEVLSDDESAGVLLLHDISTVSTAQEDDRISSAGLAAELHEIEESPWGEWYGKPISAHGIAKLLRQFEIRPRTVRVDDRTTAKGYLFSQFEDAFARYLPEKPLQRHNPLIEPKTDDGESPFADVGGRCRTRANGVSVADNRALRHGREVGRWRHRLPRKLAGEYRYGVAGIAEGELACGRDWSRRRPSSALSVRAYLDQRPVTRTGGGCPRHPPAVPGVPPPRPVGALRGEAAAALSPQDKSVPAGLGLPTGRRVVRLFAVGGGLRDT